MLKFATDIARDIRANLETEKREAEDETGPGGRRITALIWDGLSHPINKPERSTMPFVVTDSCIRCKYTDCVSVCPVNCFYEGENMLVIRPSECIDCGICEPECPVEAIVPDSHPKAAMWIELNEKLSESWPNITDRRDPLEEADAFKAIPDKYPKYFSPLPGEG